MTKHISTRNDNRGFTLIELLVVICIIGVLASIAIPSFMRFTKRGFNATAQTDLRNGVSAEEAAYVETESYVTCAGVEECEDVLPGFVGTRDSEGDVALSTLQFNGDVENFTAEARHSRGDLTYNYDSETGHIAGE